jgi:hypothetical protein
MLDVPLWENTYFTYLAVCCPQDMHITYMSADATRACSNDEYRVDYCRYRGHYRIDSHTYHHDAIIHTSQYYVQARMDKRTIRTVVIRRHICNYARMTSAILPLHVQ